MMPNNSQHQFVKEHFEFVNAFARRLRDEPYRYRTKQRHVVTERFPGLQQLFDSLVSGSFTARDVKDRVVEDWNPFSQRVLLAEYAVPRMSAFERDFSLVSLYVQTFVEWCHEAIHVLSLEPLFCGAKKITCKDEFVIWNLVSEALAFWYADIVVTRTIREYLPKNELVFNRRSVSNASFHPEHAFKQIGIPNTNKILQVYVNSFLGEQGDFKSNGSPYYTVLFQQLRDFYLGSGSILSNWYKVLRNFDFFDGYCERFCHRPNLPSLLNSDLLESASRLEFSKYAVRLGTKYLPALRDLSNRQLSEVRLRRQIQTRAYFAWFLLEAVKKNWVCSLAKPLDATAMRFKLEQYLDELDTALDIVAQRCPLSAVMAQIKKADRFYKRFVQRTLDHSSAYIKYRYRLFPYFAPAKGIIGLADDCSNLTEPEMIAIVQFLMSRFEWRDKEWQSKSDGVVERLYKFVQSTNGSHGAEIRKRYNHLLMHPYMLPIWSVKLSAIRPDRNQFREIVFEYT